MISSVRIPSDKSSDNSLNLFPPLAIFYIASFVCEMVEKWKHPGFTWGFVILASLCVFTGINRLKFFLFLTASTAYILLFRFPEVANHVNFLLVLNLTLMAGLLGSWWQRLSAADYARRMLPFLQWALVLVYVITGFHKLNQDFFHREASCAGDLIYDFIPMLRATTLGVPTALILIGAVGFLIHRLTGNPLKRLPRSQQFGVVMVISLSLALLVGTYLTLEGRFPPLLKTMIIFPLAAGVIAWELVGGCLLLLPRWQKFVLALSFTMHAALALIGFVDFGSLAFTLLWAFIPPNYLRLLQQPVRLKGGMKGKEYALSRPLAYYLIVLFGGFLAGIHYRIWPVFGHMNFLHGMILNVAAVVFFWPVLTRLFSNQRLPWPGVEIVNRRQLATGQAVFVLFLLFYGMTPYLGLRTAGNFSMFSNLRTEGAVSNHLLLRSNPLKIWGYQEDIVSVLEIDDEAAKVGHKYRPLKGQALPTVEFRKLVRKWAAANYTVPITFVHNGVTYTSQDIVNDATWQTPLQTWEMYLMDFRVIQPTGPNQCRW
ncbi:MAG: hypothetical protein AAFR42_10615 [Cyanobacteria bacterium J06628_6]